MAARDPSSAETVVIRPDGLHGPAQAAPNAGRLVMLGFVVFILIVVVAFICYLRRQARHPRREISDLDALSRPDEDEESEFANWR